MIFHNSIKSILRARGKTALFTLLIFALTLALALGVSVWASIEQFLDDCDEYYTTIGLVEYMGTGYPDDTTYDAAMDQALASFNASSILNDEAALEWEVPSRSFGYVEGFWRTDNYRTDRMLSVLVIGNASYNEQDDLYSAIVMKALYSEKSDDDSILLIDGNFGEFELGHYYLVFGEVYHGRSPLLHLRRATYENALAAESGIDVPHMIDITADSSSGGAYYVIPQDSVLLQVADTLRITNNSLLVSATDDLMALMPFHQEELYIIDGRGFTEDEYAGGSRVAVISELMAARLGIGVGDTIDLSVSVSDQPGVYNSYWVEDGFSFHAPFTVVGIMNTVGDKSWYVYVPRSAGVPSSQYPIGYTVGQAVIRNEDAAAFSARMESLITGRFQLTIYDQGYGTVAAPYRTMLRVAKIVTAVCVLMELAVILLFGFLFVYRQRETSETMRMLGTGRSQVSAYFLYSSGAIALVASAAGAAAGYGLHDNVVKMVARSAAKYALIDSRYSNGNLTISRTLEFAPELGWGLFQSVGAAVFSFAVLSCLGFTIGTFINSRPSQKKPWGPKKEHRTSHLGGGSLKYAILSILRGGVRSLVVPVLAVSVVLFFGQLATTSLRYQQQLEAVYDNTKIEGYYTDIHGKQVGNQVLEAYDVGNLYHSGWVDSLSVSRGEPYYYMGISKGADGTEYDIGPLYVPVSSFAAESLEAEILRGPDLTATNDIRKAPEFFYANTILMNYLEGYNESILTVPWDDPQAFSCIIPTSLMAEKGIALGDTIRVAIAYSYTDPEYNARVFRHFDLFVVGSYEKQGSEDTVYLPLSLFFYTDLIWGEGQPAAGASSETFAGGYTLTSEQKRRLQANTFSSTAFTLSDSRSLVAFKDYLADYGYSQVQKVSKVREFIVLKDAVFNNAVASIKQQIRYINLLYPFLYVLVGIIALTVSYLLIAARKNEFATMRGLGGTRAHAFFSFFFEQSVLCILGVGIGLLIWQLAWGSPTELHLTLIVGFLYCYFIGCTISTMIMNRTSVLTVLLDRE